jgi:hypothetical protein
LFFCCSGVFPQKTPKQSGKSSIFVPTFSNTSLSHFLYLLHLVASMPRNHNRLGATTPVPARATQCPAVELIEFFQRLQRAGLDKAKCFGNGNVPVSVFAFNAIGRRWQAIKVKIFSPRLIPLCRRSMTGALLRWPHPEWQGGAAVSP